ncbi:MAG: hypothetical protein ACLFR1_10575 [Spirochaetia bacterium]
MDQNSVERFQHIMDKLLFQRQEVFGVQPIEEVFNTDADHRPALLRSMNTAFLMLLAGRRRDEAFDFLSRLADESTWGNTAAHLLYAAEVIINEIQEKAERDNSFVKALENASALLDKKTGESLDKADILTLWKVFFPEGAAVWKDPDTAADELRKKRNVSIKENNPNPVRSPSEEIIFTSNALLTLPGSNTNVDELGYSKELTESVKKAESEEQLYWYDHPIQIGIETDANEVIYGLRGLQQMMDFEIARGNADADNKITVILSVSITHKSLRDAAQPYLQAELEKILSKGELKNLSIHVFTENDTHSLIEKVFHPLAKKLGNTPVEPLRLVFGVDGEYGRHYSFLKAIAALWQVCMDSKKRATFKIDLDQVFPQEALVEETGASTFEHFMTPLWGAKGEDSQGEEVELGLIAGALVNEKDIKNGVFTPDVDLPEPKVSGEQVFFYSRIPQAVSTKAEMMTRYLPGQDPDGRNTCLQRVHVTGGTNGILIDSLRKYKPFTPSFIGRAEDQCYLLSVLSKKAPEKLRYLHSSGLIMRHDKEAFAGEAMKAAKLGKTVGDYARMLWFSAYADDLAGSKGKVKKEIDPFTGAFVSELSNTIAHLRMSIQAEMFFRESQETGTAFFPMAVRRLQSVTDRTTAAGSGNSAMQDELEIERRGWDMYYQLIDALETGRQEHAELLEAAGKLLARTRVNE